MSRRNRILRNIGLSLAGLLLFLAVVSILIVRSDWFHNFVRQKIIATTEESTGGKVEIGSFDFDWTHLRVTIRNFVLHGTEPSGQAPLAQAALVQLDLKLLSGLKQVVDLQTLLVDHPQANLIVYPDGRTNVPEPKVKTKSDTSALETIVDLKIGKFDLTNGMVAVNAQKAAFSARGENLHAQLGYNMVNPSYKGQLTINPLFLTSGKNTPVNLNVSLPVVLEKDRIQLSDARITTLSSQVIVSGVIEHLASPRTSAQVNAKLALNDVRKLADLPLPMQTGGGLPDAMTADFAVNMDENTIKIQTGRVTLGQSNIEASGTLKDPSGKSAVQFNTSLALGELGRLFKVSAKPEGVLQASGTAKLTGQSDYLVNASVHGGDLGFQNGAQRIRNVSIKGQLSADPKRIALNDLKLAAFGGEVTGRADLENMAAFHVDAQLHGFNTRTLARTFGGKDLPYEGIISGPVKASGDIKAPGTKSIVASVNLGISPGQHGVPVNGKLNADYNGASDLVKVANSYVALPHTRLDLSGALDRELQLKLVSSNLNDLEPAVGKPLPIQLEGGSVSFTGAVTGKLASPRIAGHLQATNFALQDRPFDRFDADLDASSAGARIQNGSLGRTSTQLQFSASAGLKNWSPEPYEPLTVNANIRNADLADLMAIAGQKDAKASGTVNAVAQINGTIGSPRGNANLTVVNGAAFDEHFDRLAANVDFSDQQVQLTNTQLTAGTARIDLNGAFQHPKNSFDTGTLQFHVASNQMSLDQFNAVKQQTKGLKGTAQLNADVAANLQQVKNAKTGKFESELLLKTVNANVAAHNLNLEGKKLGDLTATAQTAGSTVNFNVNSDFAGSTVHATGQTQLQRDYPTTATASIANLPIEQVLAVIDRRDINAKGNLSANAQVSGTLGNPQASADLTLTKAVIYDEPLDRVQGRFSYNNRVLEIPNVDVVANGATINANLRFDHPTNDFQEGSLRFHIASNQIQLGKLHVVQQQKPGLNGMLQLNADGAGTLRKLPTGSKEPPILFSSLNANLNAQGLEVNRKQLGDLALKAETHGSTLDFNLTSNLGKSNIHGQGKAQLQGDYPVTAQVSFSNLTYSGLLPLLATPTSGPAPAFDVLAEGQVDINGPALKPDEIGGTLNVAKLLVSAAPRNQPNNGAKKLSLQNEGPIVVALNKQVLNIRSAHITGPSTDINLAGSVSMNDKTPLNLQVNAKTNLKVLEDFDRDIYSAGDITLQAAVRGTFAQPNVTGQLRLQNASVNMVDLPNGISNANGVIQFNGTSAVIQDLTAESGGGVVKMNGGLGFTNGILRYGLRANAANVRVRTPQGASVVVSSSVNLTGTSDHSVLGGTVTVNRIAFNPRSDFGSMLSRAAPPIATPSAPSGPLAGMKLDIRIRTAPDVAFQTALAQNLQADADLTLRGTLANPGMLGRVNVTSGKLVFFGSDYDVNSGSISFYNPLSIDPILDVDLETKAQGVDVILTVSGPVNNMKLTYRSDPPLQFTEIVALLAAGRTPTSDPTILANQPTPPPQSLEQMGESAIVSQAVAGPLADRMSRVFGISKLKIDPSFSGGSQLPQARLTLQQQISTNVTFTYITDVTAANSQIIRVEWTVNPQWSAVATRDQTGRFGVDFFFKKQFR